MNHRFTLIAAAAVVLCGALAADAAVLGESFAMTARGQFSQPIPEPIEFSFSVYTLEQWTGDPVGPPESKRRPIFDRLPLTEQDVGRTIFVPASQIPGAIELLTNGVNNLVHYELSTGTSGGWGFKEYPFLIGSVRVPPGVVDFAGKDVTRIGLRVDRLKVNDPVPGYDYSLTILVLPEPSSAAALVGVAGTVLLRRRTRRNRICRTRLRD